jgi:hypothetical protein
MASTILTAIFGLGTFLCSIYLLYLLWREKGGLHALLGFFFPPYPYVWGWFNAGRLQIVDVMVFWTIISIAAIAFPTAMGMRAVLNADPATFEGSTIGIMEGGITRGSISPGMQANGRIDDLFGVDEWTLSGTAGQSLTIWCSPASGSEADPRIKLLDPNGNEIASDDDSGGDYSAVISNLVLPSTGTYRIQVDVWSTGPYVIGVQ